ncbi:hypothetical protein LV779_27685 [Streptomyces thinghirensis]|nr:hypothetical protein [Streptomyces thinghirensis]
MAPFFPAARLAHRPHGRVRLRPPWSTTSVVRRPGPLAAPTPASSASPPTAPRTGC